MARTPKFKHFSNSDPDTLMEEVEAWVNGETENTDWVTEFQVVVKSNIYHAFVKYLEITE